MPTKIVNAGEPISPQIVRSRQARFGDIKLTVDTTKLSQAGTALIAHLNQGNQLEADNSFITEGVAKWVRSSQRTFELNKNESGENAVGFTDKLTKDLEGDIPNFILELQENHRPSQGAVQKLTDRIHGRIGTMGVEGTKFEFATRRAHEVKGLEDSIKGLEIDTFNTPKEFRANLDDVKDMIQRAKDSKTLPPEMLAKFDNAEERIALSAINGLILKSPQTAVDQLSRGDFDPWLTDESKATALNKAGARVEDIKLKLKREEKVEQAIERDKEMARLLVKIDEAKQSGTFNPADLIIEIKKSKALSELQKARHILVVKNEKTRRKEALALEEKTKAKDKETASILLSINKSIKGGTFEPDELINKINGSKTLSKVEQARHILFVNNERARRKDASQRQSETKAKDKEKARVILLVDKGTQKKKIDVITLTREVKNSLLSETEKVRQILFINTKHEQQEDKAARVAKDKETATLLTEIDEASRRKIFNAPSLLKRVNASKTLSETEKARQRIFINNEVDRRTKAVKGAQDKVIHAKRIAKREEMADLAEQGGLTYEMIAKELEKPGEDNPFSGVGGAQAWQKLRDKVRNTRPKFFRLQRNAGTVSANRGLVTKVFDGELSVQDIDAMQQQAILNDAPQEQRELLNELAGVVLKQSGGLAGQRDNQIYVSINNRIRDAKIAFGTGGVRSGTVDSVSATVTELIILQRDIIRAERLGKITKDESQTFLTKIMLGLEKQVAEETGLPFSFMGVDFGGGPEDIYDSGYEQIVQLLEQNNQADDVATKAALMRTFVFLAEKTGLDKMKPGLEKNKALDQLGKAIKAQYAGLISPKLKGLDPENLPNAVFINGRVFSLFDGVSSAHPTKRLDGNIETVQQTGEDGIRRIFQFIKGTNPPITISSRRVEVPDIPENPPNRLSPLGTEIIGKTSEGRSIIQNPDGTRSSERTTTMKVDDKWVNFPTIFNAKEHTPDEALAIMQENDFVDPETGREMEFFDTQAEAEKAAAVRSEGIK